MTQAFEQVKQLDKDKIPYYGCILSVKQFEECKDKQMTFFEADGVKLFPVMNSEGKIMEYVFYVLWR